jgi:uncharacterized DUF497 family protein
MHPVPNVLEAVTLAKTARHGPRNIPDGAHAPSGPGRIRNLQDHALDFVDAPRVFEGTTFTFEDDRFRYGEQRFVTLGLLAGVPVSIVHTESEHEIRIISFRKATRREAEIFFGEIGH